MTWETRAKALEHNDDVQECPQCGGYYSAHSPAWGCFGCAVGLR